MDDSYLPSAACQRVVGYRFGAGLGFGLGGLDAFAEGRYQAASYGEDSDLSDLSFAVVTAAIGLSISLGGG